MNCKFSKNGITIFQSPGNGRRALQKHILEKCNGAYGPPKVK